MIQRMMDETNDPYFIRVLIKKLMPIFIDVQYNIFGNFLCQKVIESSTCDELKQIIDLMCPIVV